ALFVPLIISSGGNSGSQAATLIIRAMALGEVTLKDWWHVMRREIVAGLWLGAVLGWVGFFGVSVWAVFSDLYGPHSLPVELAVYIYLSSLALPRYTLYSLFRGFAAYGLSLVFTLIYGRVAAYSRRAERVMVPLLDILQSIPVLGFLPGLVLALVAIFPHSNFGLELSCVIMIFTGQAWNMTFSFYHSLRSIPAELGDAARVYRLTSWQRFLQ